MVNSKIIPVFENTPTFCMGELVASKEGVYILVTSTCNTKSNSFAGVCIHAGICTCHIGEYSENWVKSAFARTSNSILLEPNN